MPSAPPVADTTRTSGRVEDDPAELRRQHAAEVALDAIGRLAGPGDRPC